MKLSDYLAEQDLKPVAFARKIGRSPSTISRLLRGLTLPDWETVRVIKQATGGAVTADDWSPASKRRPNGKKVAA